MATRNAIAIVKDLSLRSPIDSVNQNMTLVASITIAPTDSRFVSVDDAVEATVALAATANQIRTAIINAVKAYAAAPPSSADNYTLTRLLGLVDIAVIANP